MDFEKLMKEELEKRKKKEVTSRETPHGEEVEHSSVQLAGKKYPEFSGLSLSKDFASLLSLETSNSILPRYRIRNDLNELYYIPDFITLEDEACLWKQIHSEAAVWTELRSRRLQCFSSIHQDKATQSFPKYIQNLVDAFIKAGIFQRDNPPNHVLLNEYIPGEGIMHHTDGEKYQSHVACISLNSPCVFSFIERQKTADIGTRRPKVVSKLLLEPRSVIVFKNEVYLNTLHGLNAVEKERCGRIDNVHLVSEGVQEDTIISRGVRVSITFRMENIPEQTSPVEE
mmetsp:Transcript_6325/g.8290  ORF Transcript_6325/g.8290 Transcript_6325/m.8290 type:complete len:285 (+) Transcript_6325:57-911(+)